MNNYTKLLVLAPILGALAFSTACKRPKVMVGDRILVGTDKVARTSVKEVTRANKGEATLSNYYIQICDINAGTATNCRTTLVLENITNYTFVGPRLPF